MTTFFKKIALASSISLVKNFTAPVGWWGKIATLMSNRSYSFHITDLNSNHIRLSMEIDYIKKATQLLTDELI